jgi:N-acetylmuramoyl-L-alanine amidase
LAIARELETMLKAEPGLTAALTRTGDYFIPLQERRRIARYQHKADIFISIHADAAENRSARGASVFALSLKGAGTATSRFARMLAERENRSDLIGGAAIEAGDNTLRNVLADMVVAGSLDHSLHMGRNILDRFSGLTTCTASGWNKPALPFSKSRAWCRYW